MNRNTTCCFTGHRPEKLPWGDDETDSRCLTLKERMKQALEEAYHQGYRHFITGMALGIDTYFAELVLDLREREAGVTLEVALPCETQSKGWSGQEQARYRYIIDQSNFETMVQRQYTKYCMLRRNRYMVDHASRLIAVYDGQPKGGTMQTILYAIRQDVDLVELPVEV